MAREVAGLAATLPLNRSSSAMVRIDEERAVLWSIMITGPEAGGGGENQHLTDVESSKRKHSTESNRRNIGTRPALNRPESDTSGPPFARARVNDHTMVWWSGKVLHQEQNSPRLYQHSP